MSVVSQRVVFIPFSASENVAEIYYLLKDYVACKELYSGTFFRRYWLFQDFLKAIYPEGIFWFPKLGHICLLLGLKVF